MIKTVNIYATCSSLTHSKTFILEKLLFASVVVL